MFGYVVAGLSFGLSAGFSPGPLFAMVISQTIQYGLKEGIKTAISPLITDVPIILLSSFLLSGIQNYTPLLGLVSLAGGIFLSFLAYENIRFKTTPFELDTKATSSITKGALVNALSPHPYLFWLMVGSPMLINSYAQGMGSVTGFILSFYIALVGSKICLALIVHQSRDFLQGRTYTTIMKLLGIVLFVFSLLLFKDALRLLTA